MKPAPPRPKRMFCYNPDTGDLRWSGWCNSGATPGEPVGDSSDTPRTTFNKIGYTCVELAWWLHTGAYSEHVKPIDGNWSNLKASNLRIVKPRYIRLTDDGKLRFIDGRFHIGLHRLKPKEESIILAVKFRKQCTFDDLVEILWPDADTQPLALKNNIAVHIGRLNNMLKGCRIDTSAPCGVTIYKLMKPY